MAWPRFRLGTTSLPAGQGTDMAGLMPTQNPGDAILSASLSVRSEPYFLAKIGKRRGSKGKRERR